MWAESSLGLRRKTSSRLASSLVARIVRYFCPPRMSSSLLRRLCVQLCECLNELERDRRLITLPIVVVYSQANGQNCIGIERFIVHRSIYDQFISLLTPRVKSLRCGSSLSSSPGTRERPIVDCGAMISDQRFDELEAVIGKAVHQGAKLVCGGKRMRHETWKEGHYFEPTMLVDVTHDMDVARQERELLLAQIPSMRC